MTPYEEFRRAVRDLMILAEHDMRELWPLVRDQGKDALFELLPDLIDTYGSAAQSLAADFYDRVREIEGVPGHFTPIVEAPKATGSNALVGWATATAADDAAFQQMIAGGMQRRIVNQSREVVKRSSYTDPRSSGWMRIGSGGCDFCAMLIHRGAVYTERTVDFKTHDHCNCNAAPAFNKAQVREITKEFAASQRIRSAETKAEDDARAHAWAAKNL